MGLGAGRGATRAGPPRRSHADADRRELYVEVLGNAGQRRLTDIRQYVDRDPGDADRCLLFGSALCSAAWTARGADRAENTTLEQFERDLHAVLTEADAGKEIRVYGSGPTLQTLTDRAWTTATTVEAQARTRLALYTFAGSAVFVAGYATALLLVAIAVVAGRNTIGELIMVLALAGQLRGYFDRAVYVLTRVVAGRSALHFLPLVAGVLAGAGTSRYRTAAADPPDRRY